MLLICSRILGLELPPVNYLREGDQVFVGADGRWWRAFRSGDVPVSPFIKGQKLSGRARTVLMILSTHAMCLNALGPTSRKVARLVGRLSDRD